MGGSGIFSRKWHPGILLWDDISGNKAAREARKDRHREERARGSTTLTYSKDQTPSKDAQRRMKVARQNLNGETGLITSSLLSSYKAPTI
jgi:hypothetical protein